jgi:hypothetical protein
MNSNDQGGKNLADMKKLQSNFTTHEQSNRLLELGVPADSADCYYLREHEDKVYLFQNQKEYDNCISKIRLRIGLGHAMPCWSVGRLIEIYEIVGENAGQCVSTTKSTSRIESLVQLYEENATLLDFSKLEE